MKTYTRFVRWPHVLAAFCLVLGLPAALNRNDPTSNQGPAPISEQRQQFDGHYLSELEMAQPTYVFVGNSMLESRIDAGVLNKLTRPKRNYLLSRHGSGSAVWYILLKHHLGRSRFRPERVFIFFRDNELTNPNTEVMRGWGKEMWQTLLPEPDPVFDRILAESPVTWKERLSTAIERAYPLRGKKTASVDSLVAFSRRFWALPATDETLSPLERELVTKTTTWNMQTEANEVFSLPHLRSQAPMLTQSSEHDLDDFDDWLPRSFLPEIISIAKVQKHPLCFIRTERRPNPDGSVTQSPKLQGYISKLRAYIEAENCLFHDFTNDPEITLDWFGNEDHLNEAHKPIYTEKFHRSVPEAFQ